MKKALLIIDVQSIYTDPESGYYIDTQTSIISNINKLVEHYNKKNDLVIYVAHKNATDGSDAKRMYDFAGESGEIEFVEGSAWVEYDSKLQIIKNAVHIIKHQYDAFIGTNLQAILENNGVEKVVIVGFMTNFCCESTARTAHDFGYYVDFVKDATGTPGTEECSPSVLIETTCSTINGGFGQVVMTKEIL